MRPAGKVAYRRQHGEEANLAIEKIAVVGAGVMGRGIAHAGALGGFEMTLHDVDGGALKRATGGIEREMRKAVEKGKLEEGAMRDALGRISATDDLEEAVSGAGLVIEAGFGEKG